MVGGGCSEDAAAQPRSEKEGAVQVWIIGRSSWTGGEARGQVWACIRGTRSSTVATGYVPGRAVLPGAASLYLCMKPSTRVWEVPRLGPASCRDAPLHTYSALLSFLCPSPFPCLFQTLGVLPEASSVPWAFRLPHCHPGSFSFPLGGHRVTNPSYGGRWGGPNLRPHLCFILAFSSQLQ